MVIANQLGPSLWALINERIVQEGPLTFSQFQEMALYHPQAGFYSNRGGAGRGRDFITSPEVGPLFAHVIGNAIDKWWRELGRPNPFYFIEVGAGPGTLAQNILSNDIGCSRALRYIAVERATRLRAEHTGRFDQASLDDIVPLDGAPLRRGPLAISLPDLPDGKFTGIVFCNELLDNLPFDVYERRGHNWYRVKVGISKVGGFEEVLEPVDEDGDAKELGYVQRLAPNAPDGGRVPVQRVACEWLEQALGTLDRGRVVAIDYCRTTSWMASRDFDEWCRTYRGQRPGTAPLDGPGTQDITCEVAIDQLSRVQPPVENRAQEDFLDSFGLADFMADARDVWHGRASVGDLDAMKARGRVQEGRALTDPQGLGRYRVLEWQVG